MSDAVVDEAASAAAADVEASKAPLRADIEAPPSSAPTALRPRHLDPVTQHHLDDNATAATVRTHSQHHPRLTPCSLNPASWSKRRVKIAMCGCLSSILVCTVRLLLDPGPSAYVIHSLVILVDMVLIHVFTYTPWLSVSGELIAVTFATCFHVSHEKVFELLETTLIAALVSFHMIGSRNDHWDREEDLERDVVGMQLFIEYKGNRVTADDAHDDIEDGGEDGDGVGIERTEHRRMSSLSKPSDCQDKEKTGRRGEDENIHDDKDVERGATLVPQSDMMNISSFTTPRTAIMAPNATVAGAESKTTWWNHFFDHFLDGSAGVMYTSFVGLIIDEIVNFGTSKY